MSCYAHSVLSRARIRLPLLAVLTFVLQAQLHATEPCSLIARNPFYDKEKEVTVEVEEMEKIDEEAFPFEFQGLLIKSGEQLFRIQNKESDERLWLALGDQMDGMQVLDFYQQKDSLSVVYNEKNQLLPLKERSASSRRIASRSNSDSEKYENRISIRKPNQTRETPPRLTPPKIPNRLPPPPKRFVKPEKA